MNFIMPEKNPYLMMEGIVDTIEGNCMKYRVLSGIQPTGRLHIGNYLGALTNFVQLQEEANHECLFMVADLHSLTQSYTPEEKRAEIMDLMTTFLAAGLDPLRSTLFRQSRISEQSELYWLLSTITYFGELSRMTQYKDKVSRQEENINSALFTYPVLMAADILLYDTEVVPVGEDQVQHLELTRDLARRFNNRFGQLFIEPKALMTQATRVMSLDDPTRKMSKSLPGGCLFIDDTPEIIHDKVGKAVTDSDREIRYDEEKKPGISNLLTILSGLTQKEIITLEKEAAGMSYGDFKKMAAETISNALLLYREAKGEWGHKQKQVEEIFQAGEEKARKIADKKIREVKRVIGLL